ncbi:MAG: hypothetical protein ABR986_04200 [Methanomassiliicoccales archaeon]|jgi:hypothetical protein
MGGILRTLKGLSKYYPDQAELLKGFEKDRNRLEDGLKTIDSWIRDIDELSKGLGT